MQAKIVVKPQVGQGKPSIGQIARRRCSEDLHQQSAQDGETGLSWDDWNYPAQLAWTPVPIPEVATPVLSCERNGISNYGACLGGGTWRRDSQMWELFQLTNGQSAKY